MRQVCRFIFFMLFATIMNAYDGDMLATISYYDKNGKFHTIELPYLVDPRKIQYGVKFGIMIYYLKLENCQILVDEDMVDYFAAYIVIPVECNPLDVIKDTMTHGADFVFVNVKALEDYDTILTNTYEVPVIPIDLSYEDDIFRFVEVNYDRRYVTIEFNIVN